MNRADHRGPLALPCLLLAILLAGCASQEPVTPKRLQAVQSVRPPRGLESERPLTVELFGPPHMRLSIVTTEYDTKTRRWSRTYRREDIIGSDGRLTLLLARGDHTFLMGRPSAPLSPDPSQSERGTSHDTDRARETILQAPFAGAPLIAVESARQPEGGERTSNQASLRVRVRVSNSSGISRVGIVKRSGPPGFMLLSAEDSSSRLAETVIPVHPDAAIDVFVIVAIN